MVCASSRAGAVKLISDKIIRLNRGDLRFWVVNPEEEFTKEIFKVRRVFVDLNFSMAMKSIAGTST